MPGKVPDEALRTGLSQARKKARYYVLIAKGTTAVKLIVQKKQVKAGDIQKAKTEAKGSLVLEGTCQGQGAEMVFQVLGEEPTVKTMTIKDLIAEQTELTLKARFEVVKQLAVVDENDEANEDENARAPANSNTVDSSAETAPPPAPPPAPPTNVDPAIAQLTAAMNKLSPVIQTAAKNNPNRRDELLQGVATFQAQIKASDAEGAKATLLAVGKLVKELAAPPAQNNPNPEEPGNAQNNPGPQDPQAAAWQQAWQAADAEYQAALKTAPSDLASKLRVIHAYAFEQGEAQQYSKAMAALERLRPLLAQAAQGKGAGSEVAAGTVEKRKFLLERFKVLPGEIRPSLDELHQAIVEQVPNEDPDELIDATEIALNVLYDKMRDEIDAAITAGDMSLLRGIKERVTNDALVAHLFKNPLIDGSPFKNTVLAAIDEVEAKLAS